MRTVVETVVTHLYKFEELSEEAQDRAVENNWDICLHDYCWSDLKDNFETEIAPRFGLSIDNTYWSGFYSQGDGACFTGSFEYAPGMLEWVRDHYTHISDLYDIAKKLAEVQRKAFYQLHGNIKHRGHYYHSGCTDFTTYRGDNLANDDEENGIKEIYRELMDYFYRTILQAEYEFLTSRDCIEAHLEDSEYEFDEDGELQ